MEDKLNGLELLSSAFRTMDDPRSSHGKIHSLSTILMVAVIGLICGADDWVEVELLGKSKLEFFHKVLGVAQRGIPSHDTIGRVFSLIDKEAFNRCFVKWVSCLCELDNEIINLDGKTVRRSSGRDKSPSHIVSAWANSNRMVLGQLETFEKSNEITAIPVLLKLLSIKGCIITIDAMGAQTEIASQIIDCEADYVLALKANQGDLEEEVRESFEKVGAVIHAGHNEDVELDHGRIEYRNCYAIGIQGYVSKKISNKWKALRTIVMVDSKIEYKNGVKAGQIMEQRRFYISSLPPDAKKLNNVIRSHWGIETSLHWVLDIAFREDDSRVRKGNAAANMNVARHIALNKIRQENSLKVGVKAKRKKAGWDNNYLLKIIKA